MSKMSTSKAISRHSLFGPPPILEGEDAAVYDELFGRVCAAVKPVDVIDEMFIADVMALEWEVLRWRRLKSSLTQECALSALKGFLSDRLDYDQYRKRFVDELAKILQPQLPEDDAKKLARDCADYEPKAVDMVNKILKASPDYMGGSPTGWILNRAKAHKAEEMVQDYVRREPRAVKLIQNFLAEAGTSIDALMVEPLAKEIDYIERIDRLTTIAESRRNASLREIDRRRAALGESLRRSVQQIEDAKFEVIETTPAKRKNAA
jgi:hypothetical protein